MLNMLIKMWCCVLLLLFSGLASYGQTKPAITETDFSQYFNGINGSAVIYNKNKNNYLIYNLKLANERHSPCSTFKIISSLTALENGIINPDNSIRTWNKENFWNKEWNKDMEFSDAFRTSCVWYFRRIIDEIEKKTLLKELKKLKYGNQDVSDWNGKLNTNDNNPSLTGFWIESSLLISPKEQTEVMERIFGDKTTYSKETINRLKDVMLYPVYNTQNTLTYGKTGLGKYYDTVVDAWYVGFAEKNNGKIYFSIYLTKSDNKNVSSIKAREITIKIISDLTTDF